ncbi:MAG TPA: type II secretion system protein [Pseudacidobacterium sp.]|nr:type II secretion system protein [Pseudacidobacterium sp.]
MHRQLQSASRKPTPSERRVSASRPGESGYILLTVLFMIALILIALAVAAPRIAASIQRDKEAELIHRGLQYRQAIKLYYKKFGRYPSSIDQLEKTNNIRFLRKRYVDPMTGKDDWKIVLFGQAHVKAMGLFGQPIANSGTAGSSVLGGGVGQSGSLGGVSQTGTSGAYGNSGALQSTSSTTSSSSDSSSDSSGSTGNTSTSGTSTTGSTSSSGFGSSSFGSSNSGQTFGGAPMVGVVSKSQKASIKEYKQQKHYNEWEFVYDPLEDMQQAASLFGGSSTNVNGTGSNSTTTPGSSTSFPSSSNPGTSNPGTSNPTTPTSPQQ